MKKIKKYFVLADDNTDFEIEISNLTDTLEDARKLLSEYYEDCKRGCGESVVKTIKTKDTYEIMCANGNIFSGCIKKAVIPTSIDELDIEVLENGFITTVLRYASENGFVERDAVGALVELGLTRDDFENEGYGDIFSEYSDAYIDNEDDKVTKDDPVVISTREGLKKYIASKGWVIRWDDNVYLELRLDTLAHKDFGFRVEYNGSVEEAVKGIKRYAYDFNKDKHIKANVGVEGAPNFSELAEDAKRIQEELINLADGVNFCEQSIVAEAIANYKIPNAEKAQKFAVVDIGRNSVTRFLASKDDDECTLSSDAPKEKRAYYENKDEAIKKCRELDVKGVGNHFIFGVDVPMVTRVYYTTTECGFFKDFDTLDAEEVLSQMLNYIKECGIEIVSVDGIEAIRKENE